MDCVMWFVWQVTVDGKTHCFSVGRIPTELRDSQDAIESKMKEWEVVLAARGVSTLSLVCQHSEKLALAYAVICGQRDITLRKNLRVCSVCHDASVALTSVEGVVVRHMDQKRVHVMRDGVCTCQGRY